MEKIATSLEPCRFQETSSEGEREAIAFTGSGFLLKEDVEKVGVKAAARWESIMK
jgi:hypothetical protein